MGYLIDFSFIILKIFFVYKCVGEKENLQKKSSPAHINEKPDVGSAYRGMQPKLVLQFLFFLEIGLDGVFRSELGWTRSGLGRSCISSFIGPSVLASVFLLLFQ